MYETDVQTDGRTKEQHEEGCHNEIYLFIRVNNFNQKFKASNQMGVRLSITEGGAC